LKFPKLYPKKNVPKQALKTWTYIKKGWTKWCLWCCWCTIGWIIKIWIKIFLFL